MVHTLSEIASALGADLYGDGSVTITRVSEPAEATHDHLALAMDPKYADGLKDGQARAAMLWPGADWKSLGLDGAIIAPRPRFALAGLSSMMDPGQGFAPGIHPSALVDPTAEVASDASVGPFSVIAAGAKLGAGAVIGPQCYIGKDATLGAESVLREHVSIGARVTIGARFIAQPGVRIGGDGFSYVTPEKSAVEEVRETLGAQGETEAQSWTRIHSLGAVTIGDDVEIGANSCVDCGTIRDTQIGHGVKIDNLVQIGHNAIVGEDCLICAMSGVAGSAVLGDRVVVGAKGGINDNITIGDDVVIAGASRVFTSVPAGRMVMGDPAVKMDLHLELYKSLRRLPRLIRDFRALQKSASKGKESH